MSGHAKFGSPNLDLGLGGVKRACADRLFFPNLPKDNVETYGIDFPDGRVCYGRIQDTQTPPPPYTVLSDLSPPPLRVWRRCWVAPKTFAWAFFKPWLGVNPLHPLPHVLPTRQRAPKAPWRPHTHTHQSPLTLLADLCVCVSVCVCATSVLVISTCEQIPTAYSICVFTGKLNANVKCHVR